MRLPQKTRAPDSLIRDLAESARFRTNGYAMDNSFMVGLSAQRMLQDRMDTTANNLANLNTAGFKAEALVMRKLTEKPAMANDVPNEIDFVDAWTLQRDFSTGPMQQTGNPLDMAIEGEGFFVVQTPKGDAYTRDGRFMLSPAGQLVTSAGELVMGAGGPISVDPTGGPLSISREGTIEQDGAQVGTIKTVAFDTPAALEKVGANLWRPTGEAPRTPVNSHVSSGFVEGSNVNAVVQLTDMIEISRTYAAVSNMITTQDELRGASIEKLSRVG